VVYLAKEVPWDYGNLYLQKTTSLKKHLPSIITYVYYNEEGETLLSDHSSTLVLSMDFKNTRGKETLAQHTG